MKKHVIIYRALANINRLKIINMLSDGRKMSVGDIADNLKISFTATSNHLAILRNLDVLEARGELGHVFYFINVQMPVDFREIINLALKQIGK